LLTLVLNLARLVMNRSRLLAITHWYQQPKTYFALNKIQHCNKCAVHITEMLQFPITYESISLSN